MDLGIQSDIYIQIKSSRLEEIKKLVEDGSKHLPFRPNKTTRLDSAVHHLKITNGQAYDILCKAIKIVQDTEEYTAYLLNNMFGDEKNKQSGPPPGTVRFYAKDLICFYTGKTWRKIK